MPNRKTGEPDFGAAVRHALDPEAIEVVLPADEPAAGRVAAATADTPAPSVKTTPRRTARRPAARRERAAVTPPEPALEAVDPSAETVATAAAADGAGDRTFDSELERLRGEVDALRARLGRGGFERYEIPVLVLIAAVLVAVIVIQLKG